MRKNIVNIMTIFIILLIFGVVLQRYYYKKEMDKGYKRYKTEVLRNDSLKKISETQYRKLIADTLTISQLNKRIKTLELELSSKPKVIIETVYLPKEIIKEVEVVKIIGDTLKIEDYYPNREEYFIKYENEVSLKDTIGTSKFSFQSLKISSVISERKDGVFQIDFKTPEWLRIESLDVQATPIQKTKEKNFGLLLGAGVSREFNENKNNIRFETGIRYKKTFLDIGINTANTADLTLKFEL